MNPNPFFPLDEMGLDSEENQMMVIPKVDQEIYEQRRKMAGTMVNYKEMRMRYSCAIKEVRTKFDVLNSEFNVRYQRNPITSINSRLKSSASIMEKLSRKGLSFTVEKLYQESETQWVPQLPYDRECTGIFLGSDKRDGGGGADPHHSHGLLGKSGASVEI